MKRELKSFDEKAFDLLVLGGGIYGAAVAWEAAGRGLSTALIERYDFGSKTTANSLKTVHGGLRYLQNMDLQRVRQCIRERTILMGIAPHLVHPLPCLMPTYGHGMKGKEVMRAGLLLNDIVSCDRNRLEDPQKRIPGGRILSREETLRLAPGIDGQRVTGGAFWTDAQMSDSERLAMAFVRTASRAGACVANEVEGTRLLRRKNRIEGVEAVDRLTGKSIQIRARLVVNTGGGWMEQILRTADMEVPDVQLSTAMNLVVNRNMLPGPALGITSRFSFRQPDGREGWGSRVLFMAPWKGATLIGTRHRPFRGEPDDMVVTEEDISDFLKEINAAYSRDPVRRDEVTFFHKGFLPMDGVNRKNGEVILTRHAMIHDHVKSDGVDGLISVSGVKYTTARDEARRTVDLAARKLNKRIPQSISHRSPLVGGDTGPFEAFMRRLVQSAGPDVPDEAVRRLAVLYGTEATEILKTVKSEDPERRRLPGGRVVFRAEILHAVREEMALHLTDVVLRRTDMGSVSCPDDDTLEAAAASMAGELGWDSGRKSQEVEAVRAVYRPNTAEGRLS